VAEGEEDAEEDAVDEALDDDKWNTMWWNDHREYTKYLSIR